ncbi:MAG: GTP cyclohydrolase I, partial [Candidatus Dormibacteraceae bacterium]
RLFARRFTVQERIGHQVADTLQQVLEAHGVAVYLEGTHLCTQMRGVCEVESMTRTTVWRGVYEEEPELRSEFLSICERQTR